MESNFVSGASRLDTDRRARVDAMTDAAAPMSSHVFSTPYTPVEGWFEPETPDQPGGGEGNNQDSSVTVAAYAHGVRFVPHRSAGAEGGGGLLSRRRTKNSTKISTTSTRVTSTLR